MSKHQKNRTHHHAIFFPKIISTIQSYSLPLFWGDLSAGFIVGIVALPLAIAFAIASGVTPERGLTTAIIAGFLISILGGSRVQIGGPTGAFVVIIYGIVERFGVNGLILCTMLAGLILILMGLLRLGAVIKFIPYPLTVGFTTGIAVIIFCSQIRDFLGLETGPLPGGFIEKWQIYIQTFPSFQPLTLLISCGSLLILLLWPKINRRIPASMIAVVIMTAVVHLFHIPVETIGSRFGDLPTGLPQFGIPHFTLVELRHLIAPAFTVALLGAIESLLSATVADSMTEGRHRSNTELIAQGIANLVTPLFGGIPATGAIARTATNIKNGGKTPIAGIIHAITLLLIVLLFGKWAKLIPLGVLATILMVVAYHMSEWHAFKSLLRAPRMDIAVLLVTFCLTVLIDLTIAVEIGMLLSLVLFMKRMMDVTHVREVTSELKQEEVEEAALRKEPDAVSRRVLPPGVVVYEVEGAFFFGVASTLRDMLALGENPPKVLILRMRHVLALDASGLRVLKDLHQSCKKTHTQLILSGIHAQPMYALDQSGIVDELGSENVLGNIDEALKRAMLVLERG